MLSATNLFKGLERGDRQSLARSITLVESTNYEKAKEATKLLTLVEHKLHDHEHETFRIGLSGPPGAGKSTFIEALGKNLTAQGHKVAVLAVDPSSSRSGGSLLGDKTRMAELSRDPKAFIRPSPNSGHLGGVARTTNESVLLCEAAGFDIVLVETVGVGQSEYLVAEMTDMFCLLIPPAGGDELQAVKRGIVEQTDLIAVNKCDGDLAPAAKRAKSEYLSAVKYAHPKSPNWHTRVKLVSALNNIGIDDVWNVMEEFRETMNESGELTEKRAEQRKKWMWSYIRHRLLDVSISYMSYHNA